MSTPTIPLWLLRPLVWGTKRLMDGTQAHAEAVTLCCVAAGNRNQQRMESMLEEVVAIKAELTRPPAVIPTLPIQPIVKEEETDGS